MQAQGGRGAWGCSAAPLDAAPRRMKTRGQGEDGRRSHEGGVQSKGARVGSGGTRLESQYNYLKTGFWKQNPQNRSVS